VAHYIPFNPVTVCSLRMYRIVTKPHHILYFIKQFSVLRVFLGVDIWRSYLLAY